MGYKFYYRAEDNDKGITWLVADESEYEVIKETSAYHVSTNFVSREVVKGEENPDVKYRGDFYLDIDHKGVVGSNPADAIERAIEDVRKVQKYFMLLGVNLKTIELFISGGKGFHIRIPIETMGGIAMNNLPLQYKHMAKTIIAKTGATGIDLQLYCLGMGHFIRVENKQRRKDGRYKVQISWEELDMLDANSYYKLASAPRPKIIVDPPEKNNGMVTLLNDAAVELRQMAKFLAAKSVDPKHFSALDGDIAPCAKQLCEFKDIKERDDRFHAAKLTLARYLVSGIHVEEDVERYIKEFSENFESQKFPSPKERERELRSAMRNFNANRKEFECSFARYLFNKSPCHGCPVQKSEVADAQASSMVEDIGSGYYKKPSGKRTEPLFLSNFVLEPIKEMYEVTETGARVEQTYTFLIHYQQETIPDGICTIRLSDFLTNSRFKTALQDHPQTVWIGKDEDVQWVKKLVTSQEVLEGVEKVIPSKKQGMVRIIDSQFDIDEYVWVQKGWSWNGKVPDTVEYQGPRQLGDSGEITTFSVNLKDVDPVETPKSAKVFQSLLQSRGKKEIAVLLGWVSACWLKPMITSGEFDPLFPVLHAYGIAGSGKTQMTQTFSILAGYDGVKNQTLNVSNCTAYYLKAVACSTTTIPQIFDEFNVTKLKSEEIHRAVREVFKSTATKQAMGRGKVVGSGEHGQVATETVVCSSPLVMLSTAQNQEQELLQRAVVLYLNKDDIHLNVDTSYIDNFKEVSKAKSELFIYTGMLMSKAISIKAEELQDYYDRTEWIKEIVKDQRSQKGLRCVAVGLYFAYDALKESGCGNETLELIEELIKDGIQSYLDDKRYSHLFSDGKTETDNVIDTIIGMAQLDDGRGDGRVIKEGIHYIMDGTLVHFKIDSIYVHFLKLAKELHWMVEYPSAKGFIQALDNCEYYCGSGKAPGVAAPSVWHAFHIQGLIDKNIDVSRLNSK